MDISNIIALILGGIGFLVSIISLILTPKLNLKSKRLEKKLEYRSELFQKILELWEYIHDNQKSEKMNIEPLLKEINKLIQLYGYNSEIKSFKKIVISYNNFANDHTEENNRILISNFNAFFSLSFNTYRAEITLEKLEE